MLEIAISKQAAGQPKSDWQGNDEEMHEKAGAAQTHAASGVLPWMLEICTALVSHLAEKQKKQSPQNWSSSSPDRETISPKSLI